jgi:hypothetical protein
MPRPLIGETAMSDAERQARYRAARAAGQPAIRTRRPADRRGLARRWTDTVAGLVESQARYAAWLEALPGNQQRQRHRGSVARDLRTRSVRASGDRTAARLRP